MPWWYRTSPPLPRNTAQHLSPRSPGGIFLCMIAPAAGHPRGGGVFYGISDAFIRHELEDAPGPSGPPEETSSVVSPPLGAEPGQPPVTEPPEPGRGSQQPPSQPDGPDVQLPPPEVPQPHPDCGIPMTDGTPAACRQKNAAEYLAGRSPGVMTQYGGGLRGRAASSQPRTCARRRPERRFTVGRVARRSALRLKEM